MNTLTEKARHKKGKTLLAISVMPALLAASDHACWLDPGERDPARVLPLLAPCPSDWLTAVEVSRHVNNPRNDDPRCIEPVR